jgi:hypothetical protein
MRVPGNSRFGPLAGWFAPTRAEPSGEKAVRSFLPAGSEALPAEDRATVATR